jgi:hypothetical protein
MALYTVAFVHNSNAVKGGCDGYVVILETNSLEKAFAVRVVTGDLVFDAYGDILQGDEWLFDFEKRSDHWYSRRCQKARLKLGAARLCSNPKVGA